MEPSLLELEARCQKPDYRRVGNWMARRISRPLALRITRVLIPCGVSAHGTTLAAWLCGLAAAGAFAQGSAWGWVCGAALLQVWYLLDHVDGQLARFHGTASLDGVQLDYLMHHTLNLLVPLSVGCGLFTATLEPWWALAGLVWGLAALLLGLRHDARYKAFVQRLKRLEGRLEVIGGGGARPEPPAAAPRSWLPLASWLVRKACEPHATMNLLGGLSLVWWLSPSAGLLASQLCLFVMAPLALALFMALQVRSLRHQAAEQEFAAWYAVPDGRQLVFSAGWWIVEPVESLELADASALPETLAGGSS